MSAKVVTLPVIRIERHDDSNDYAAYVRSLEHTLMRIKAHIVPIDSIFTMDDQKARAVYDRLVEILYPEA